MKASIPLLDKNTTVETDIIPTSDRRSTPRIDCHTVVTAVAPHAQADSENLRVIKAHSEDFSVGGAKLISREPLPSDRLFLRFLLPTFGDRYVEAVVVNHSTRERTSLTGPSVTEHVYGVRFTGVMSDDEMMNHIMPSPADQRLSDNE